MVKLSDFGSAFIIVVGIEGEYSDDPKDPGGKTKFGITEDVAREHGYVGEMRDLSLDFAEHIYKQSYWDVCKLDQILAWPLKLFIFDAAVNQGVQPAIKMLQQALNTEQDGVIGPTTLGLANRSTGWHASRFMAMRALRYASTKNFDRFGEGWMTRLFELRGTKV
jgi:lysozyme family protein